MALPARDDAAGVVKPGEEPFYLPAATRASERAAILGLGTTAAVRRDHLDPVGGLQRGVEQVAVVAAIADQSCGEVGEKPGVEGGGERCGSYGEALATWTATGRP